MYAVFNRGRRILLYSLDSRIAFTYDVKRNSWSVLDANFGLWLGDAAVVGDVMFCYGALTKITWAPPSSFHVRAYDLEEKIWLPHHVGGLEDEGVLPPLADRGQPGYISLIRIHSRRLCLIWAKLFRVDGYPKLNVHCTKFSIHRRPGKRKREAQFYASNLSHVQYVLDGWCILRCFLMGSAPPVEEDTIKERRKKNEGHDGETSGVERLS
ncbi:hypothetical protein L1049_008756 [Liquidambar formosana]|uniref:Uncharacterized protein n=1 Tax=Liquidambar formosana TaxID=63359 RepID=A0AAP0SA57_LIQFO